MKPFRWNLKKREQLGTLLGVEASTAYDGYIEELSECASKLVARSKGKRIVFVGRSPENIFDYLSGLFQGTSFEEKVDILNISNRFREMDVIKKEFPGAHRALTEHFIELGISPEQVIAEPVGVCFADLVAHGGTFERLFEFIQEWTIEDKLNLPALVGKLGFLGITQRTKTSPNTWRWQQHAVWVKENPKLRVQDVSIPASLWDYLSNRQSKVAKTNQPKRWASEEIMFPPREEDNLKALKQAYEIYTLGLNQKREFVERLASTQEFKEAWLRSLASELRSVK